MDGVTRRSFPARLEALGGAIDFVEAWCASRGVGRADALRLTLVVEELFTNTVLHGHGGGSDAPLSIGLGAAGAQLRLDYVDSAPPFDPRPGAAAAAAEIEAEAGARPVGRLGLPLVASLAHSMAWTYEDGTNRLRLLLARRD